MRYLAILTTLCVALAGCTGVGPVNAKTAFMDYHADWQSVHPNNYQFTYLKSYGIPQNYTVTVEDDEIVSVYDNNQQKFLPQQEYGEAKTIDDLFDIIRTAFMKDAARLDVDYNERYGYPEHMAIDYSASVADDEVYYSIIDFVT